MSTHKGIKCPNPDCDKIGTFTTGQQKKGQDILKRPKTCKTCGTTFWTMEVPIGGDTVQISNNHIVQNDPVQQPAVAPQTATVPPVTQAPQLGVTTIPQSDSQTLLHQSGIVA